MAKPLLVTPGRPVRLSRISPEPPPGTSRQAIQRQTDELESALAELDDLLYFARENAVLVVLQGLDTSGKDGMIRKILDHCNAQGVRVEAFKTPTAAELAHDFLWRVHSKTPARGEIVLFNRSHYEDVLVARVHRLAPESIIGQRYEAINDFERLLVQHGTIVVKFFLHVSHDEQERRLLAREREPDKAWKLSTGDWRERKYWNDYRRAYELALSRCSTRAAPWHIVPANQKWYRNHVVLEILVERLAAYRERWMRSLKALGEKRVAELEAFRAEREASKRTGRG
jgi:PPK2 family polyphosphate:nucleotide phosphotransferase